MKTLFRDANNGYIENGRKREENKHTHKRKGGKSATVNLQSDAGVYSPGNQSRIFVSAYESEC
jgi:hypothetical protein